MVKYIISIIVCFSFFSCGDGEEMEITISGRLIDGTHNRDLSKYEVFARSIYGSTEKSLANTKVDEDGYFQMTYSINTGATGDYLRMAIVPFIIAQDKFEFLPIGESWHKTFHIGDSARVFIKLSEDLKSDQTIHIQAGSKKIEFKGPSINKSIGEYRVLNKHDTYSYYLNDPKNLLYKSNDPTGDPIVDTLTLTINP